MPSFQAICPVSSSRSNRRSKRRKPNRKGSSRGGDHRKCGAKRETAGNRAALAGEFRANRTGENRRRCLRSYEWKNWSPILKLRSSVDGDSKKMPEPNSGRRTMGIQLRLGSSCLLPDCAKSRGRSDSNTPKDSHVYIRRSQLSPQWGRASGCSVWR